MTRKDLEMIEIINKDITLSDEQYIVHQCNCLTKGAAGLAKVLFDKYPYANVYADRTEPSVPGTIDVRGDCIFDRGIINLFGQYYPGGPTGDEPREQRVTWFINGLLAIKQLEWVESLAFPYQIGCGIAGGDWNRYNRILDKFAEKNPHIKMRIYCIE